MGALGIVAGVGCLCIGAYKGNEKAMEYQYRLEEIRHMRSAILSLEVELSYMGNVLYHALDRVSKKEPVKKFFTVFKDNLKVKRTRLGIEVEYPGDAWVNAIEIMKPEMHLKQEDWDVLTDFGHTVGVSDKETGIGYCEYIVKKLEIQEQDALEQLKMMKLWRFMGVGGGLTVGMFFL